MSHTASSQNTNDARRTLSEHDPEFARRLAEALARRRKALQNSS